MYQKNLFIDSCTRTDNSSWITQEATMADVEEPIAAEAPVEVEIEVEEEAVEEEVVEKEEEFVAVGGAAEVKLFGKWSFDDIEIRDISLVVSDFDLTRRICKTKVKYFL